MLSSIEEYLILVNSYLLVDLIILEEYLISFEGFFLVI
jgi:hypothetical protein